MNFRVKCLFSAGSLSLVLFLILFSPAARAADAALPGAYPIHEGYVDSSGVLIYYKTLGSGPPLLVVHGGPGASHDYLLPHLIPLARKNTLVFIDERGSGRSQRLENSKLYTVENMADDVEAVRRELRLGKINLLGPSSGGAPAHVYTFKYE